MNNNRKQKINSILESLTKKELDNYIKENNIKNKEILNKLNYLKSVKEQSHTEKLQSNIGKQYTNVFLKEYKLGQAAIIAFIFDTILNNKFTEKDIINGLKQLIDKDNILKEYTYEIMKD